LGLEKFVLKASDFEYGGKHVVVLKRVGDESKRKVKES
jgi:hypothetical protein